MPTGWWESGIEKIPDGRMRPRTSWMTTASARAPCPSAFGMKVTGNRMVYWISRALRPRPRGESTPWPPSPPRPRDTWFGAWWRPFWEPRFPPEAAPCPQWSFGYRPGSLVNASLPASVAAGNVETSQRITDVLLQVFGKALPDLAPALSQGTMNNTTVGGVDPRTGETFAYYETVGGGLGAAPQGPGLSGVHSHMSNSLNTPIEALEHAYPFRVAHYGIRRGSGGDGSPPGGDGLRRDIQLLTPGRVTLLTERRLQGPREERPEVPMEPPGRTSSSGGT